MHPVMDASPGLLTRTMERAYGVVRPMWYKRRLAYRRHFQRMESDPDYAALTFAALRARGYKSAQSGRNDGSWLGHGGSGDAELTHDLPSMRNRSRELDRDDSVASGIFKMMVGNIVGRELRPQARTADREKNKRLESVWRERKDSLFPAERVCMGAVQRRMEHRTLCDGDVWVKPSRSYPGEPVWFELVEGDRIATPLGIDVSEGGRVQDGVIKDASGRWVSVFVKQTHPGEPIMPGHAPKLDDFTPVPANRIWQSKLANRAGQTRGEPLLHSVLQDVQDLDLLILAALKRTQIAACLAVFIRSESDAEDMLDLTAEKYGYRLNENIEPGMMWKLFPNESIETLVPNFPLPELLPFIIVLASRIGAAIGVTWQYVLKDFSKDTYSSARTGQLASEGTWDIRRHDLCADILTHIWVEIQEDARLRGDPRLNGVTDDEIRLVEWQGDGRPWVDPAKKAKEKEVKRALGIETHYDQCQEAGFDAEEQIEREMQIYKYCIDAGMPEDVAKTRAFGAKAGGGESAQDDADKGEKKENSE